MKKAVFTLFTVLFALTTNAQGLKKVYNENINPIEQIDQAVAKAKSEGKFVVCFLCICLGISCKVACKFINALARFLQGSFYGYLGG